LRCFFDNRRSVFSLGFLFGSSLFFLILLMFFLLLISLVLLFLFLLFTFFVFADFNLDFRIFVFVMRTKSVLEILCQYLYKISLTSFVSSTKRESHRRCYVQSRLVLRVYLLRMVSTNALNSRQYNTNILRLFDFLVDSEAALCSS
jgi:hypothetical protein